mmetsp:Transcript_15038/g.41092  ORF Transcript_15038/g.41092 Transcript_15038/m.41092 type:complete len:227 (-) Transcript_15038:169-849(-)
MSDVLWALLASGAGGAGHGGETPNLKPRPRRRDAQRPTRGRARSTLSPSEEHTLTMRRTAPSDRTYPYAQCGLGGRRVLGGCLRRSAPWGMHRPPLGGLRACTQPWFTTHGSTTLRSRATHLHAGSASMGRRPVRIYRSLSRTRGRPTAQGPHVVLSLDPTPLAEASIGLVQPMFTEAASSSNLVSQPHPTSLQKPNPASLPETGRPRRGGARNKPQTIRGGGPAL